MSNLGNLKNAQAGTTTANTTVIQKTSGTLGTQKSSNITPTGATTTIKVVPKQTAPVYKFLSKGWIQAHKKGTIIGGIALVVLIGLTIYFLSDTKK